MPDLFTPLQIRSIVLRNRIVVSPMCQYSSKDGFANDWHLVHLGSRAVGGAGLVMTEATSVSPEGRISIDDLGIWKDEHIDPLQRITRFIIDHGAVPGMQLAHAGRKGSRNAPWDGGHLIPVSEGGFKTVAPCEIPFSESYDHPVALTKEGIRKVIADFRAAAKRAEDAGFRIIEIHAAHGYLIHEFLSPITNLRDDEYGGSFENRIRLLVGIVNAVKEIWPEKFPLFVRISSTDWSDNGFGIDDAILLAKILKEKGVDLIDCSSGGIIPGIKIPAAPGYQVPFAESIRNNAGIMTGAVGMIITSQQAEEIIVNKKADLVIIARELLRDPYFPLRAARELGYDFDWPVQYRRAKK
jgi:2,4-dienoyl-CoA reductase-like NADH-dependent reductase (Old Yellow Enzyme family)